MTEKDKQELILTQLREVCGILFRMWNTATQINDSELRRLVIREASENFYGLAMLYRQVDSILNKEEGVFHA